MINVISSRSNIYCAIMLLLALFSGIAQAAADTPKSGSDWYLLGRSLQQQKQWDKAAEAFQHAYDEHFQPAGAAMRLAQITAAQGKLDDALRWLQQAYDVSPAALGFLPKIGGVPQLEGNAQFASLMARAQNAIHPCLARKESRQFDFWLGDWTVSNPQGQVVGHNQVTSDLSRCVIREHWKSALGYRGTSVNFYDPATKLWHQVWTSENGTITHYQGSFHDGAMRFDANGFGDANGTTHYRKMTFTPNKDGSVRQLIEDSDNGKDWKVSFDGIYRKSKESS